MLTLRINEILKKQGKTPYWLSKKTGISPNNIGKICNGETSTIRFDTIEKICKVLNCHISEIFYTDDPQLQRLFSYQVKFNELQNNKGDTPK